MKLIDKEISSFKNIVFLGNGGAVKALIYYMNDMYDMNFTVLRRNSSKDNEFPKDVTFRDFDVAELTESVKNKKDTLLIQATSAPLMGESLEGFISAIKFLDGVFVDIVYKTPSALYYEAQKMRLSCIDGLPMLVEQAVLSQKYWWGESIDSRLVYEYLEKIND